MVSGYQRALSHPEGRADKKAEGIETVKVVLKEALKRRWRDLTKERI